MDIYEQGYISIPSNSNTVTGTGTRWKTYAKAGDIINLDGNDFTIQSVDDFNKITITSNYTGIELLNVQYSITINNNLIERLKKKKEAEIFNAYQSAITNITSNYDQTEINSWYKQETQARSYIADSTATVPFLTNQALSRGITELELANIIISKADAFEIEMANALGKRQKLMNDIVNATTKEELDLIVW